jgi:hypothetical protein
MNYLSNDLVGLVCRLAQLYLDAANRKFDFDVPLLYQLFSDFIPIFVVHSFHPSQKLGKQDVINLH